MRRAIVEPADGRAMIDETKPSFGPVLEDASQVFCAPIIAAL